MQYHYISRTNISPIETTLIIKFEECHNKMLGSDLKALKTRKANTLNERLLNGNQIYSRKNHTLVLNLLTYYTADKT